MSVLALITDATEARPVVAAAQRSAVALETGLRVSCYEYSPLTARALGVARADASQGTLVGQVFEALSELQNSFPDEKSFADSGAVRWVRHSNPVLATVEATRTDDIQLVVASAESKVAVPGKQSFQTQLLRHVPCNLSLVTTSGDRIFRPNRVLAVVTDSADDRSLVAGAHRLALAHRGQLTVAVAEPGGGHQADELGNRELETVLRGAGVAKKKKVKTKVLQTDDPVNGVISIADKYDVIVLGSKNLVHLPRLIASTSRATISIFRKAPPIRPWQSRNRLLDLVPSLCPADYADIVQNLRTSSRWNADFRIMLGLAVGIASLGLLLNSTAVIIGSMLLAPLMTPMVGTGLALVQGNARLARTCINSVGRGILMALAISILVGLALPGDGLTPELTARGSPNAVDLLIALLSAAAGAYALARPTLAGSIAGVAIATALVPPLCTVGISLADRNFDNAAGAAMLFVTNYLAIVMAAAGMFRWMGLGAPADPVRQNPWVRPALAVMLVATLLLAFPLSQGLISRLRKGVSQAPAAPLSQAAYDAVQTHIDQHPGVSLVFGLRRPSSLDRSADYRIVVASGTPLPRSFGDELVSIVRKQMADQTLRVEVIAVPENWMIDEGSAKAK